MISRIVSYVIAVAAIATASGVLVVSAAYALFALLQTYLSAAGAAACVTLAAAILIAILALVFFRKAKGPKPTAASNSAVDRLVAVLRDRPAIASAASLAAGLIAWRNPALVSVLLRLFEPKPGTAKAKR